MPQTTGRLRTPRGALVGPLLLAVLPACSFLLEDPDLVGGEERTEVSKNDSSIEDGAEEDGPEQEDDASITDLDSSNGGNGDTAPDAAPPECLGTAGPPGIKFGTSSACIDRTEVSNKQYADFLAAKAGDTSGQPAICAWNTSYDPSIALTSDNLPVRGVDWCDARAYCQWAGKRLCGKMPSGSTSGGSLPFAGRDDVTQNQWMNACTSNNARKYPYGNTYVAGNCANSDTGSTPKNVGSLSNCVTPAGVYDLVGNAVEFLDSCDTEKPNPKDTYCLITGGGYANGDVGNPPSNFDCRIQYIVPRDRQASDIGIRCCSP